MFRLLTDFHLLYKINSCVEIVQPFEAAVDQKTSYGIFTADTYCFIAVN